MGVGLIIGDRGWGKGETCGGSGRGLVTVYVPSTYIML